MTDLMARPTVESCKVLDVLYLYHRNLLQPNLSYSIDWLSDGEPDGNIIIFTDSHRIWLVYRAFNEVSTKWKAFRTPVPIIWTPCPFGGRRPWFRCPGLGKPCGRKVAKLFLADYLFACRSCHGLAYESQRFRLDPGLNKVRKIERRLGLTGSEDWLS